MGGEAEEIIRGGHQLNKRKTLKPKEPLKIYLLGAAPSCFSARTKAATPPCLHMDPSSFSQHRTRAQEVPLSFGNKKPENQKSHSRPCSPSSSGFLHGPAKATPSLFSQSVFTVSRCIPYRPTRQPRLSSSSSFSPALTDPSLRHREQRLLSSSSRTQRQPPPSSLSPTATTATPQRSRQLQYYRGHCQQSKPGRTHLVLAQKPPPSPRSRQPS